MSGQSECIEFGLRVRQLREERGLSQEGLGQLANLDRTFISSIEAGRRNVTLMTIHKLAKALDVEPGILLTGSGKGGASNN